MLRDGDPNTASPPVTTRSGHRGYRALGMEIASDFCFSSLPQLDCDQPAMTILARCGAFPAPGRRLRHVPADGPNDIDIQVFENADGVQYWVDRVGKFWIEARGTRVWYSLRADADHGDVEHFLVGPILGLAAQLQGRVLLHAGAVQIGGVAVAFSAPHGYGKSTLVASLARSGMPFLTDDVLPLQTTGSGIRACLSLPRIKLWEDSVAALGETRVAYRRVVSWLDKRRVTIGENWGTVARSDLPLAAIYLLAPHLDPGRGVEFAELTPSAATLALMANMYMAEMLEGERARHALRAAAATASVRLRRVSYHRAYETLPALKAAIIADLGVAVAAP